MSDEMCGYPGFKDRCTCNLPVKMPDKTPSIFEGQIRHLLGIFHTTSANSA